MTRPPVARAGRHPMAGAAVALCATLACTARAQPVVDAAAVTLPTVEVVSTTPLPGTGVPRDQIPANVQTVDARRMRQLQSLNLPELMNAQLPSVSVHEVQGNPYQADVNYRGQAASPLLGTPQGLSVFLDGVRVNEAFGDIVNWDLLPRAALAGVTLLPGSNPLFGLNTLGGALALQTRSGDTHPGTEIEWAGGAWGRRNAEFTHGRRLGDTGHLFVALAALDEDGWREASPSRVHQLFAKGGQRTGQLSWELGLAHADNRLVGNGPVPESMLAQRREQVYTRPDVTDNQASLVTLNALVPLGEQWELAATAYARRTRAATLNADLNDAYDPPTVPQAGVENRTRTRTRSEGLALQASLDARRHHLSLGLSHDRAHSRFVQSEAQGELDAARAVVPTEEAQVAAQIAGRSRTSSVYATDLITLAPELQLTVSGRYNDTRVSTVDEGRTQLALATRLDSEGRYRKFNPALGLTWQVAPAATAYGGWSQGNRAPSPIELGCSDPAQPCVLPNALQADPPLRQVVSRTLEAGLRGTLASGLRWNASAFRSVNQDDLLFISNGRAAGYFSNFGRTLRQGLELSLSQQRGRLGWAASYSHLRATFGSSACLVSEANSTADTSAACTGEHEIEVRPGNRLPGLPAHTLKLSLDVQATPGWAAGLQMRAQSWQYVRGNENNAHRADGVEFLGSGRVPGFAVFDLTGTWKPAPGWELFGKVSNLFDRRHATGGLLGANAFDHDGAVQAPADWRHEQFVAPGAPRAAWIGLRLQFGGDGG